MSFPENVVLSDEQKLIEERRKRFADNFDEEEKEKLKQRAQRFGLNNKDVVDLGDDELKAQRRERFKDDFDIEVKTSDENPNGKEFLRDFIKEWTEGELDLKKGLKNLIIEEEGEDSEEKDITKRFILFHL